MTSEFDDLVGALQIVRRQLGDRKVEWDRAYEIIYEVEGILSDMHEYFAHELGRKNIKITPNKFQTDHFLSMIPCVRVGLSRLEKLVGGR